MGGGLEVLFHVSFLMPFVETDVQSVGRKRHIGNDIVVIVFRERGAPPFDPGCIASQFNHIFLVVTPCHGVGDKPHYRLQLTSQRAIGTFGPALYDPPLFAEGSVLRDLVLTKLINGERAALTSMAFADKVKYARKALLELIVNEYGGGMPKKRGSRILNPFKRIGSTRNKK